jgi:hypothetical protein
MKTVLEEDELKENEYFKMKKNIEEIVIANGKLSLNYLPMKDVFKKDEMKENEQL